MRDCGDRPVRTHHEVGIRHVMRTTTRLAVAAALVAGLAACGGDDGGGLSDRADQILSCASEAGLAATREETTAFGVEAPHEHISVTVHSDAFGDESEADVWIFEDSAAAREARPAITFQNSDTETNRIVGSSLVHYNSVIPDPADAQKLESCL
jgi:hypothetical protein